MTKKQNFFLLSVIVFLSTVETENLAFASSVGKNDSTAITISAKNDSKMNMKNAHYIKRKLIYILDGASRRMCGSNNSPALASRVQSKLHDIY